MRWTIMSLLALSMLVGCEQPTPDQPANMPRSGKAIAPVPPGPPPAPGRPRDPLKEPTVPAITGKAFERVKAEVGVGKKGRRLDNPKLVKSLVTPARAFFRTQERLVFEVQLVQALNLYKATNGKGPQSQEQFMKEIVEANNIKLPELPAGHRYVYDPKQEQLMVERPVHR